MSKDTALQSELPPGTFPTPQEMGLPGKFHSWRSGQIEAILYAVWEASEVKRLALLMPTGAGKSPTYIGIAAMLGLPTVILTATKLLQDQLRHDFAPMGLVDIRGRNNYKCPLFGTCEVGKNVGCRHTATCPSDQALAQARHAQFVVTNYTYWLIANRQYYQGHQGQRADMPNTVLGPRSLLILDEAHDAPMEITRAVSVQIHTNDLLKAGIDRRSIPTTTDVSYWQRWASKTVPQVTKHRQHVQDLIMNHEQLDLTEELIRLDRAVQALSTLASITGDWAMDATRYGYIAEPLWPSAYVHTLWCGIDRAILTSATLLPKTLDMLGIPADDHHYREFASTFPRSFGPVYYWPVARIDFRVKAAGLKAWIDAINAVLDSRSDRKGIIHAVSYDRARYICEHVDPKHRSRLLLHDTSSATVNIIEQFRNSTRPMVLVSPSVVTGVDFPGPQCEFAIIAKVPFLQTKDQNIQQARKESDPDYDSYVTAQKIAQATGRGRRSETDRCEVFIIDSHFGWFYSRNAALFPRWFRDLVRTVRGLPPLSPKL